MKIQLRDLRKSFGPKLVLDGVDLDVEAGESLVVIGGSLPACAPVVAGEAFVGGSFVRWAPCTRNAALPPCYPVSKRRPGIVVRACSSTRTPPQV